MFEIHIFILVVLLCLLYFRSGNQNNQLSNRESDRILLEKAFLSSFYGNGGGASCLDVISSSSVLIEMEQKYKAVFENEEFQEIELSSSR